jgi:hypothetical protein
MSRGPKKRSPKRKTTRASNVVDIQEKRVEKLTERVVSLSEAITKGVDARVAALLDLYRTWERQHPDDALKPHHKLAMVRYGFVGPGGFTRCHEPHRLPQIAFLLADGGVDERIERDNDASEVVMCPAMEAGLCQGAWRAMQMPPCHLLLLEVYQGLGGGAMDDAVDQVLDDVGCWYDPDDNDELKESFARAERLLRKYADPDARRE